MDLTQFHPLQKTMMRVFFEALCIRLGKVEELKRRISECKDGTEYYAFPDMFEEITTHEVIWTLRTGLSPKYMKFLNDIVFVSNSIVMVMSFTLIGPLAAGRLQGSHPKGAEEQDS